MCDWFLVIAMAILTFIPRYLPFGLAGKIIIPPIFASSLKFVPIAVLSSIITQSSIIREGELSLSFSNYYLLATLVSLITSRMTNQLLLVVSTGMFTFYFFRIIY